MKLEEYVKSTINKIKQGLSDSQLQSMGIIDIHFDVPVINGEVPDYQVIQSAPRVEVDIRIIHKCP
jgi:hypothetical protein